MTGIAVNKVLAAASRRQVRDFVDLAIIHKHVVPLWVAIWAAPGKDAAFNPISLVERLSRFNHFPQSVVDDAVDSWMPINVEDVSRIVLEALDEAREIFPSMPRGMAGKIFIDARGKVAMHYPSILAGLEDGTLQPIGPVPDGGWTSVPDIDSAIMERLIGEFGFDGSSISTP
jgi:hypothetical protein